MADRWKLPSAHPPLSKISSSEDVARFVLDFALLAGEQTVESIAFFEGILVVGPVPGEWASGGRGAACIWGLGSVRAWAALICSEQIFRVASEYIMLALVWQLLAAPPPTLTLLAGSCSLDMDLNSRIITDVCGSEPWGIWACS